MSDNEATGEVGPEVEHPEVESPRVMASLSLNILPDGNIQAQWSEIRPTLFWMAAEWMRNIGDTMWHEQRMAQAEAQMLERQQIQRVADMLRRPPGGKQ